MSVCRSVRMNAEILETIGARLLRFGVQVPELLMQRKFVSTETNLRCVRSSGICTPNLLLKQTCAAQEAQESACQPNSLAPIVSEISAFIRTDGQTDILIKNIYTLWGRKRFLPPDQEYIYFMGSETLPSTCYILYILYGVGNDSFCLLHTF